jgi:XTP/dITP diphosphohydrolase
VRKLVIATRNTHKLREIRESLGGEFEVVDLAHLPDAPEVEETGDTFLANATLKALAISRFTEEMVLADDSGLEVEALGGAPGVHSARYAGGHASDADNREKLLHALEGIAARGKQRAARFVCVLVAAQSGTAIASFDGYVEGTISNQAKGSAGFGYDPIFIPAGHCATFAELPAEVKATESHRARALTKMRQWLSAI